MKQKNQNLDIYTPSIPHCPARHQGTFSKPIERRDWYNIKKRYILFSFVDNISFGIDKPLTADLIQRWNPVFQLEGSGEPRKTFEGARWWMCRRIGNRWRIDFRGNISYTSHSDWCKGLMFDSLKILDLKQIRADPDQSKIGPRLHHQEFGFFWSQSLPAQPTSPSSWCSIQHSGLVNMEKFRNFQLFSRPPPILRIHLKWFANSQFSFFCQDFEESRRSAMIDSLIFLSLM